MSSEIPFEILLVNQKNNHHSIKLHEMGLRPLGREEWSIWIFDNSVWQWEPDLHILQI